MANSTSQAMTAWRHLSGLPGGKWLFSRLVTFKAPYFASIKPVFAELRPGYCEVHMKKRRSVLNHIGTIHAIAMCNMAELAGGTMTDVTVPPGYRWIPKGMSVDYLAKATSDLRAIAELPSMPDPGDASDLEVPIKVLDDNGKLVLQALITMWVSRRRARTSNYRAVKL